MYYISKSNFKKLVKIIRIALKPEIWFINNKHLKTPGYLYNPFELFLKLLQEEITPDEIDEMDDIDKVRDDLQSTKQMLALEMRNKEAQERENKRLLARILNLEAELEKERNKTKDGGSTGNTADDKVKIIIIKIILMNERDFYL